MDAATRRFVRERAAARCEYCLVPAVHARFSLHVEHIIATKHGGTDAADNLALACIDCNLRKGPNLTGIDPHSGEITILFNPRQHTWSDHFRWEGPRIEGLTPMGRTTVAVLSMNTDEMLEFRETVRYWDI